MKQCYFNILLNLVWGLSAALHMVRYKYGMNLDFSRIMQNGEYPEHDPLNLASLSTRQRICDEIIIAKQYIPIYTKRNRSLKIENVETQPDPASINFQRLGSASNLKADNLGFTERQIIYTSEISKRWMFRKMRLLECVRIPKQNWFVALTRLDGRMFLMEYSKSALGLVFTAKAIIEPMAGYNTKFTGQDGSIQLKRYLTDQVFSVSEQFIYRNNEAWNAEKMSLCSLTYNEISRLCSVSFDTLTQSEMGHFQKHVRYVNYVSLGKSRCSNKKIEVVSSTEVVRADVVPCAINRNYKAPQFYVLGDFHVRGAAFILIQQNNSLEVIAHLDKIYVLLDRGSNMDG